MAIPVGGTPARDSPRAIEDTGRRLQQGVRPTQLLPRVPLTKTRVEDDYTEVDTPDLFPDECLVHEDCDQDKFCSPAPALKCVKACTLPGKDLLLTKTLNWADNFQCVESTPCAPLPCTGQSAPARMVTRAILMIGAQRWAVWRYNCWPVQRFYQTWISASNNRDALISDALSSWHEIQKEIITVMVRGIYWIPRTFRDICGHGPWICQLDACSVTSLVTIFDSVIARGKYFKPTIDNCEETTADNNKKEWWWFLTWKYLPVSCIFGGDSRWLPVLLRDKITRICNSDTDPSDICQGAG